MIGHRDCSENIRSVLKKVLTDCILQDRATVFYVGHQGAFDRIAYGVLKSLKVEFPHISFFVVLAYMPTKAEFPEDLTLFPEIVARSHPKYAILKRNQWMIEQSDLVVSYVLTSFGGAARYKQMAQKKEKRIVELSTLSDKI